MADKFSTDDGQPWGYIDPITQVWRVLPKVPMLLAELGPPPFDVQLPSGEWRHVIHEPEEKEPCPP